MPISTFLATEIPLDSHCTGSMLGLGACLIIVYTVYNFHIFRPEIAAQREKMMFEQAFALLDPFEKSQTKSTKFTDKPSVKSRRKTFRIPKCLASNTEQDGKKRKRDQPEPCQSTV